MNFRKGDYYIPLNQRANRFLVEVLEPQGDDSYFAWNYFDGILSRKEGYSPYVFEETANDNQLEPYGGESAEADEPDERHTVVVEVGGKRLEVVLPGGLGAVSAGGGGAKKPKRAAGKKAGSAASGDAVTSPCRAPW